MKPGTPIVQAGECICDTDEIQAFKSAKPERTGSTAGDGCGQWSNVGIVKSPDFFLQLQREHEVRNGLQFSDDKIRFGSGRTHEILAVQYTSE